MTDTIDHGICQGYIMVSVLDGDNSALYHVIVVIKSDGIAMDLPMHMSCMGKIRFPVNHPQIMGSFGDFPTAKKLMPI